MNKKNVQRCEWCSSDDIYQDYHDQEWGVPSFDDQHLFEMLILEGVQAGLSWITILKKRQHYREVFDRFDAEKIARYDEKKVSALLADAGIIRNRLKVSAAVNNARLFLDLQSEYGRFANYIWQFVDGRPISNHWQSLADVPVTTKESDDMSRSLKQKGFKFVGSTICYAYMQAVGMVNDHTVECYRYHEINRLQESV
jgi:DNA-3-methyladenine glycosylase I